MLSLVVAVLVAPITAKAQPPGKVPRVGVIGERSPTDPFLAAFRQGLRELGYTEGQNIIIEYRYTQGVGDRYPNLTAELIRLKVDVLVVGGTVGARSAKAQTTTVPIVLTLAGDPVGSGLVASLARPGGNATGLSNIIADLSGKQLELLQLAVPQVSRVTVLYNPANPAARAALNEARGTARALGIELHVLEVRQPTDLASALSTAKTRNAGALLVISDPVFGSELARLSKLALDDRLPAMYATRSFAEAGGLMAYGPSFPDNWRRAATYVDKILKGAKPGDLPVEQPSRLELVINLRTAKALGLTIPPSLLQRADQVIK
jgi:putative ABC transport system substrate-binding protein